MHGELAAARAIDMRLSVAFFIVDSIGAAVVIAASKSV
jgi:hypothetical protein